MSRFVFFMMILQALTASFLIAADSNAQGKSIYEISLGLNFEKTPILEVFDRIESSSNFHFSYNSQIIDARQSITVSGKRSLGQLLEQISKQTNLKFKRVNENIHVYHREGAEELVEEKRLGQFQGFKVSGKVVDEDGQALPGATIIEKGTNTGTVSDIEGNFSLTISDSDAVLAVSFVGYESLDVNVNGQSTVSVTLRLDISALEEVVVVGYGTQAKRDITGAISSIKTADIQRAVTTTADEFLQGRVAGVVVDQSSNAPGGGINIRIRGTNSFGTGNEPLFIVDGIPINNSGLRGDLKSQSFFTGGDTQNPAFNPLSTINPQDIESIEVLKDASATAVYGSRGSNGVVIITTKKGTAGKPSLEFSASVGVQEADLLPELLNAREWMELNNDARTNAGLTPVYTTDDLNNPAYDTDWQDELYRTAVVENYQLSARGGDENTLYAFSVGYFDQEGVIEGMDLQRVSGRLNLEQKANKWLTVGTSTSLSRTTQNVVVTEGNSVSVTRNVNEMVPLQPVTFNGLYLNNEDYTTLAGESFEQKLSEAGVSSKPNPMYYAEQVRNEIVTDRVLASAFGEVTLAKGLKYRSTFGADIINQKTLYFAPSDELQQSSALNAYKNTANFSIQNQLSYDAQFGDHNISAVAVHEAQTYRVEGLVTLAQTVNNLTSNFDLAGDSFGDNDKRPSTSKWALNSYLGRINYRFKNRYLLTLSGRADGSSRFGPGNRYGFFPSFSAGWVISEEDFFSVAPISSLKVRGGWGQVGNSEIGIFEFVSTSRTGAALFGQDGVTVRQDGLYPRILPNSELQWEPTSQLNLGFDAGFLDERFTLSANYYVKNTTDLLFSVDVPRSSGFENIRANVGEVRNEGFEFELGGYVLNTGDLTWRTAFNFSYNDNEVLKIDGLQDTVFQSSGDRALIVGEPINSLRGYKVDGLFQVGDDIANSAQPAAQPGERRYVDTNGDGTINDDDRVVLGSTLPVTSWGFTNNFSYKGLELSIFLQGLGGMKKFNELMETTEKLNGRENASRRVLKRWTAEDPNTDVQRAVFSGQVQPSRQSRNERYIEDASFWRIKNVTLAYNFPKSMISKLGIQGLRLSLSGQNLATFTDFTDTDPEAGAGQKAHPLVKTYTAGLNVTF